MRGFVLVATKRTTGTTIESGQKNCTPAGRPAVLFQGTPTAEHLTQIARRPWSC